MAGRFRQADIVQRAALALGLRLGGRHSAIGQKRVKLPVRRERFVPQGGIKIHPRALLGLGVEDHALRDANAEHFLQADRLGTELDPVVQPLRFASRFVFHRSRLGDPPAGLPHLDDVRLAVESEPVRPYRQGAKELPSRPVLEPRQIRMLVVQVAAKRVLVGNKNAFRVNQRSPPGTVEELVKRGEGNRLSLVG